MGCNVWALRFLVHCWSHHRPVVLGNTSMFKKSSYKKLVPNYIELLKLTYMSIYVHHQRCIYICIYHIHYAQPFIPCPLGRRQPCCTTGKTRIWLPSNPGPKKCVHPVTEHQRLFKRFGCQVHDTYHNIQCGLSYMYGYIYSTYIYICMYIQQKQCI